MGSTRPNHTKQTPIRELSVAKHVVIVLNDHHVLEGAAESKMRVHYNVAIGAARDVTLDVIEIDALAATFSGFEKANEARA
jgi:hypothetical protein